jgi:hypothetical protein
MTILLLTPVLLDELLDFPMINSRLLKWLPSFAMRQSQRCHLHHILLSYTISPLQSRQSRRRLINSNISP